MQFLRNLPIKRKLMVITMLVSGIASLVVGLSFITYEQVTARKEMVQDLSITAAMTGANSTAGLSFNEADSVEQALQSLSAKPGMIHACVYDKDGQPFARYQRAGLKGEFLPPPVQGNGHHFYENRLELFQRINLAGETVGTIYLEMDLQEMTARIWRYALIMLLVLLASGVLAFFISAWLQRFISEPISDLAKTVTVVAAQKEYSVRAKKQSNDELGQLIDGFNEMLAQIQERDAMLERRVAERTRELQQENAGRKLAEESLRESQSLYHSLVEQMPAGVFRKDDAGRFVFANSWFCRLKGLQAEQILGKTPSAVTACELAQHGRQPLAETREARLAVKGEGHHELIMRTGQTIEVEEEYPQVNGAIRYLHVVKSPMFGPAGQVVGSQGILFDITERKQAEARLAKSLSLLNATLESTADGILVIDRTDKVVSYNTRFVKMWGLPQEKMVAGQTDQVLPLAVAMVKDSEPFLAKVRELYRQPEAESFDFIELKDGRIFERYSQPQRLEGENVGRVWSFRDVTERRRAEAELAYERGLLRELLDNSPDAVFFKDTESRFIRLSRSEAGRAWARARRAHEAAHPEAAAADYPQHLHSAGQFAEYMIGKTDFDFYDESHARQFYADEQQILRTGQAVIAKLERSSQAEGRDLWLLTSRMLLHDFEGKIIGTFGISKDVTAIKEAEDQLAKTSYMLESLLEYSPDSIYFKDRESRCVRCTKSMLSLLQLSDFGQIIGKTDFDLFTEEHARPAFEDEQEIIRTGRPIIGKLEKETHHDGHETWALTTKMPWYDREGQIIGTFGISRNITAIKEAEANLEKAHRQLIDASRQAGMAEVATSVLHNVGNVLNSINVSTTLVLEAIKKSKLANLGRLAAMIQEHQDDLAAFFTTDTKGKQLPDYISHLAKHLTGEQAELLKEIELTRHNVEHIKDIVAMQQSYAKVSGVVEKVEVVSLVEDALRLNGGALIRHDVQVIRDFPAHAIEINVERQKVLQILVNLIRNAKYACDDSGRTDKRMTMRVWNGDDRVHIAVIDNGVGIPAENMTRIFNHGFTTREKGHGFGLHSGALAAKELGGALIAQSDGPGTGAKFILELPRQPHANL